MRDHAGGAHRRHWFSAQRSLKSATSRECVRIIPTDQRLSRGEVLATDSCGAVGEDEGRARLLPGSDLPCSVRGFLTRP